MSRTEKQDSKSEECHDLSNLKYKTLLENGKKNAFSSHKCGDASTIEAILENEMNTKKTQSWSRLDRIEKIDKLCQYAIFSSHHIPSISTARQMNFLHRIHLDGRLKLYTWLYSWL